MVYAKELVAGGGDVEVGLLLVDEKRVRHPDVLDELRADPEDLDARAFLERQPGIRPELPEVKIQREVLRAADDEDHGHLQQQTGQVLVGGLGRERWGRLVRDTRGLVSVLRERIFRELAWSVVKNRSHFICACFPDRGMEYPTLLNACIRKV